MKYEATRELVCSYCSKVYNSLDYLCTCFSGLLAMWYSRKAALDPVVSSPASRLSIPIVTMTGESAPHRRTSLPIRDSEFF